MSPARLISVGIFGGMEIRRVSRIVVETATYVDGMDLSHVSLIVFEHLARPLPVASAGFWKYRPLQLRR